MGGAGEGGGGVGGGGAEGRDGEGGGPTTISLVVPMQLSAVQHAACIAIEHSRHDGEGTIIRRHR